MAENFPNLKSKMDIQVQESERVLNETNPERCTLIYTLFKFIKVKDKRILKTVKEKKNPHYIQGKLHRDFGRYFIRNFTGQETVA